MQCNFVMGDTSGASICFVVRQSHCIENNYYYSDNRFYCNVLH